jgi:hypothetical protein
MTADPSGGTTGGESDGTGSPATGDDTGGTDTGASEDSGTTGAAIDCGMLDQAGCAAEDACVPLEANIITFVGEAWCIDATLQYAGCGQADAGCAEVETFACPPGEVVDSWRFPDACIPDGWSAGPCPNIEPVPLDCPPPQ